MTKLFLSAAAFAILSIAVPAAAAPAAVSVQESNPEAEVYDVKADASAMVDNALRNAAANGKKVIIVMGANWCHDSRALAGWFESPRFTAMMEPYYEIVYADAGTPQRNGQARNQNIVKRFKGKTQKNTPYVMILSADGKLLNRKDARSWRNAASRSGDDIFAYFAGLAGG